MKRRKETTHEAPELMRVFGAEVLEEKRVYGAKIVAQKRRHEVKRPRVARTA